MFRSLFLSFSLALQHPRRVDETMANVNVWGFLKLAFSYTLFVFLFLTWKIGNSRSLPGSLVTLSLGGHKENIVSRAFSMFVHTQGFTYRAQHRWARWEFHRETGKRVWMDRYKSWYWWNRINYINNWTINRIFYCTFFSFLTWSFLISQIL